GNINTKNAIGSSSELMNQQSNNIKDNKTQNLNIKEKEPINSEDKKNENLNQNENKEESELDKDKEKENQYRVPKEYLIGKCWKYVDNSGVIRGPFSNKEMEKWHQQGYIKPLLFVNLAKDNTGHFYRLHDRFPSEARIKIQLNKQIEKEGLKINEENSQQQEDISVGHPFADLPISEDFGDVINKGRTSEDAIKIVKEENEQKKRAASEKEIKTPQQQEPLPPDVLQKWVDYYYNLRIQEISKQNKQLTEDIKKDANNFALDNAKKVLQVRILLK
ncbi:MAG: hypothetical protein EZS28_007137, partial [Streblomastix strix]